MRPLLRMKSVKQHLAENYTAAGSRRLWSSHSFARSVFDSIPGTIGGVDPVFGLFVPSRDPAALHVVRPAKIPQQWRNVAQRSPRIFP